MTETKLVQIDKWRPLDSDILHAHQVWNEQEQERAGGHTMYAFISAEGWNCVWEKERRAMLYRVLGWWDDEKGLTIEQRNALRRRFNQWQKLAHTVMCCNIKRNLECDKGIISRDDCIKQNFADYKLKDGFADKYLFCSKEELTNV